MRLMNSICIVITQLLYDCPDLLRIFVRQSLPNDPFEAVFDVNEIVELIVTGSLLKSTLLPLVIKLVV